MQDFKRDDGGLDLGGGSGNERTRLRSNWRRVLVAEARGLQTEWMCGVKERETDRRVLLCLVGHFAF